MAKTIKFNLICDGYPVRNLEDLQSHFSIEDISEYYHNGLLQRWLEVRDYSEQSEKVSRICAENDVELIKELISIFEVEEDPIRVNKSVYILEYQKEQEKRLQRYETQKYDSRAIIEDYFKEYRGIIAEIIRNKDDLAKIRAAIDCMDENYQEIFTMNYRMLFKVLCRFAPMAIFAALTHESMRTKFLAKEYQGEQTKADKREQLLSVLHQVLDNQNSEVSNAYDITMNGDKTKELVAEVVADEMLIYKKISSLATDHQKLRDILGSNLKEKKGSSNPQFPITIEGKIMILDIGPNDEIALLKDRSTHIQSTGIRGQFLVANGVDYFTANAGTIYYMEV